MGANYYKHGDYNVICDRCGFKYKAGGTQKEWTGLRVCRTCWEPRNPQDYLKVYPDNQRVPDPRPEQADTFVDSSLFNIWVDESGNTMVDESGNRIVFTRPRILQAPS